MADNTNTTVHIGENSPEQVAFKLLEQIAAHENWHMPDRKKILDTYAECLRAVRGNRVTNTA
jgi:hypothetical protein